MLVDTEQYDKTTAGEDTSGYRLVPKVDYDRMEQRKRDYRKRVFPDDEQRGSWRAQLIAESDEVSQIHYHPKCIVCQSREAVREPASFAALGALLCRTLNIRDQEMERLRELKLTLTVEGAFAHGDSESLSIVVFIQRTAEPGSREQDFFGEFGIDRAK